MSTDILNPTALYHQPLALDLTLPWHEDEKQNEKFKRYSKYALILFTLFLIVVQFLPVFNLGMDDEQDIVKTTVILEPREVPKVIEPEPEPPKPKPQKAKPEVKKAEVAKTTSKPKTSPKAEKKNVVSSQGLDRMTADLAALTKGLDMQKLRKKNVSDSTLGQVASVSVERLGKDQVTQRSGGVVVDDAMMRTDMSILADHESSNVDALEFSVGVPSTVDSYGNLGLGTRDMESIRRTLESAKSRVYSMYQRALEQNPDLAGKFKFQLIIDPSGRVSQVKMVSSELGLSDLEAEILAQIQRVNFGAQDVVQTEVNYTFMFLPS